MSNREARSQRQSDEGTTNGFDTNVELYEEELVAAKHPHDLGEVRLHKRVVTTPKTITVPVMHEEVLVERVPYTNAARESPAATTSSFDEIQVPLCEEELAAEKFTRPLGEVRIHKRVVVTQKQITVPVMHEEISIERVPAERKPVRYATGMFVESTQVIPLHDEEVEIRKVPIPREGVRLRKATFQEERIAAADLRHEELDVDRPETHAGAWTEARDREFSEETHTIPLYEEEIEVRKYPVVREEVHVNRTAMQEERTVTAETLKEELDIDQPTAALDERQERLRHPATIVT